MSRPFLVVVVICLILVAKPALGQNAPRLTTPTEVPSVTLPTELDRVLRDYERAWRAGDAAALAALFAEDGFILQSNRPPIRGRKAIQATYEGGSGGPLRLRALAFYTEATTGYIVGAYGYGDGPGDTGKFTLTLRRAPGQRWLIFSDMDNQNAPPKPRHAPNTPSPATLQP